MRLGSPLSEDDCKNRTCPYCGEQLAPPAVLYIWNGICVYIHNGAGKPCLKNMSRDFEQKKIPPTDVLRVIGDAVQFKLSEN